MLCAEGNKRRKRVRVNLFDYVASMMMMMKTKKKKMNNLTFLKILYLYNIYTLSVDTKYLKIAGKYWWLYLHEFSRK